MELRRITICADSADRAEKMTPEFDQYAAEYSALLRDPIRDGFSRDPVFFHRRKWILIRDFFKRHNIDPISLEWLDVGCGRGELLTMAEPNFARAVGCDLSRQMIASHVSAHICEQSQPTDLPFPNCSFDFITAVCVYHHVHGTDRERLTSSIHRVLKPGGVFCMIEHNPWNPMTQMIVRRCPVDVDAELLTTSIASRLMRGVNLEIVDTSHFLYLPESVFTYLGAVENTLRKLPFGGQFAIFGRK
jgi:SAM-dependent methyltransferase